MSVESAFRHDLDFHKQFLLLFTATLSAFMGVCVSGFFSFHIWLMAHNTTTIEYCEKSSKKSGFSSDLYDSGVLANFQSILGTCSN